MASHRLSRRSFLRRCTAAGAAFTIVPRHVLGGPGHTPPSEEITRAIIGVGGMGRNHIGYPGARTLALCDVDRGHLAKAMEMVDCNEVKGYYDYREVLARPDIDVVHIVTPPHWHALMAADAARAGKDIWCEKPMTRTIGEGEKVVAAVNRYGRIFRLNTWFRFRGGFYGLGSDVMPVKKLVHHRLLGWPLTVRVGAATGFDWKLRAWSGRTDLVPQQVPAQLDYPFWLGPAPEKPYHPHRVHQRFRGYWDYDGGGLGDMGMHYLDPVQYILGKDNESPVYMEADTQQQHPDAVLPWRQVELRYADGCRIILEGNDTGADTPYLQGPEGKLYRGFRSDIPRLPEKIAHLSDPEPQVTDFYQAVRDRQVFALNERNGHRSCTLVNLAKIAVQLARPLRFNPAAQRFVDDPEANRLVDQPMRGPWHL